MPNCNDMQDVTAHGIHAVKPEGLTASTVLSLGPNGSRGHVREAHGQTRRKPGLFQRQVTTATPGRLDFRRNGFPDEGCAGAMPTDSPCSVARRRRVIKVVRQQAVRCHREASSTWVALGWCTTRSVDQLTDLTLRQHRLRRVRSCSAFYVASIDPDPRWPRASGEVNPRPSVHPNVDRPQQPDCGTCKRKGPEGPFILGDRAAYPNYFFAADFAFLVGAAALGAAFALGVTGAATAGATFSAVR